MENLELLHVYVDKQSSSSQGNERVKVPREPRRRTFMAWNLSDKEQRYDGKCCRNAVQFKYRCSWVACNRHYYITALLWLAVLHQTLYYIEIECSRDEEGERDRDSDAPRIRGTKQRLLRLRMKRHLDTEQKNNNAMHLQKSIQP